RGARRGPAHGRRRQDRCGSGRLRQYPHCRGFEARQGTGRLMTLASPSEIPLPPHRSLVQRAPDILVWGVVIVLLIVGFGPVDMSHLPRLFTNSDNMREFGKDFLQPK